ncbi:Autophagocytosis associated protein, active-site domain [Nesidiocoris tenuis]|uniref:Ubiquitin-like-conjugating enzyme ATG10 n=1 Tax=Nesidiocoris tenuis TaxID=355587 RepID=A0ABN7AZR5_9HEMI|nr:Autophagocytosis associated protein, active-site domain [Nesidiocoris tenuis]
MESSPLSWDEFLASSKELLCISQRLNDGWNWSDTQDGWGYLHKTELKSSSGNESADDVTAEQPGKTILVWEYHILYSPAYSCPVLYFNVRDQDGKFIGLDSTIGQLRFPAKTGRNYLSVVSQSEHPILRKPFCYLHPCHTSDLIIAAEKGRTNLLIGWLSCVAPIVRLELSLEYAKPNET